MTVSSLFRPGPASPGQAAARLGWMSLALGLVALAVAAATLWISAVANPWNRSPETLHGSFSPRRDAVQYASFSERPAAVLDPASNQLQVRDSLQDVSGRFAPLRSIATATPSAESDSAGSPAPPTR